MRVGCYAVWDMKSEALVQDCWVQQEVSLPACSLSIMEPSKKRLYQAWSSYLEKKEEELEQSVVLDHTRRIKQTVFLFQVAP